MNTINTHTYTHRLANNCNNKTVNSIHRKEIRVPFTILFFLTNIAFQNVIGKERRLYSIRV